MRLFYCLIISVFTLSVPVFAQEADSLIRKSIFFGGGSYYIDALQGVELDDFIQEVENLEHYEIVIFSHTDNIGGKEYNEWLSMMRSAAVHEQLIEIGVPKEQLKIRDFGMNNPLYTNYTTGGRRMNRRVDVILVPLAF